MKVSCVAHLPGARFLLKEKHLGDVERVVISYDLVCTLRKKINLQQKAPGKCAAQEGTQNRESLFLVMF